MALRFLSPISMASSILTGHFSSQSPQATHFTGSTYLARSVIMHLKSPGSPEIESRDELMWILMRG